MAPLLDDERLHRFTGGQPLGRAELVSAYRRRAAGVSPGGTQRWLNWVVRRSEDGQALGTVQATVYDDGAYGTVASVAWVIATAFQGSGYAHEAAQAMARWLRQEGIQRLVAHVHPEHLASERVARSIGLLPTGLLVDGEQRWEAV